MQRSDSVWRLQWRRRGLGLDRSLPFFLKSEAPLEDIIAKIPKAVEVPGWGRQSLDGDDRDIIRWAAIRVQEYFAQHVPFDCHSGRCPQVHARERFQFSVA